MRVLLNLEMTTVSGGDRWCEEVAQYSTDGGYAGGMASNGYSGGGNWGDNSIQTVEIKGDLGARERDDAIAGGACSVIGSSVGMTVTILAVETGAAAKYVGGVAGATANWACNRLKSHLERDDRRRGNAQIP